ncbi:MAG: hypothetical protein NTW19_01805 [Planctomycetota bacterium]|nr:hypothetical protein [Planctomycetota bacterium]
MNRTTNNPGNLDDADDNPRLDGNLDVALDPRLEALLNEALSPRQVPGGIPAGLADRIVAATLPQLGKREGVLARIGPTFHSQLRVLALAACVVVAVSAGLWLQQGGNEVVSPASSGTGVGNGAAAAPTAASITRDLEPIARPRSTDVDYEIAMLSARVDQAVRPASWDAGAQTADLIAVDVGAIGDADEAQIF